MNAYIHNELIQEETKWMAKQGKRHRKLKKWGAGIKMGLIKTELESPTGTKHYDLAVLRSAPSG